MIFLCTFVLYLLAVVSQPLQPPLPTFKSEETECLCSDRHAPFVKLNVMATRKGGPCRRVKQPCQG